MGHYIALLRAINLGGHTVRMESLRRSFELLGCEAVHTVLASGNVLFDSTSRSPRALESRIEAALHQALGYEVVTFIRTRVELAAVAAFAPFAPAQLKAAQALNIAFLHAPPDDAAIRRLMALRTPIDDFHAYGREIYWLCRQRQSDSTISNAVLEKTLGMRTTLRGIRTIERLVAAQRPSG